MKSILKWNQYLFKLRKDDDATVMIVAPTFVEAMNTFHEVTHVEPYSVHMLGVCYLLDSEII